jgi:hypothetical protein
MNVFLGLGALTVANGTDEEVQARVLGVFQQLHQEPHLRLAICEHLDFLRRHELSLFNKERFVNDILKSVELLLAGATGIIRCANCPPTDALLVVDSEGKMQLAGQGGANQSAIVLDTVLDSLQRQAEDVFRTAADAPSFEPMEEIWPGHEGAVFGGGGISLPLTKRNITLEPETTLAMPSRDKRNLGRLSPEESKKRGRHGQFYGGGRSDSCKDGNCLAASGGIGGELPIPAHGLSHGTSLVDDSMFNPPPLAGAGTDAPESASPPRPLTPPRGAAGCRGTGGSGDSCDPGEGGSGSAKESQKKRPLEIRSLQKEKKQRRRSRRPQLHGSDGGGRGDVSGSATGVVSKASADVHINVGLAAGADAASAVREATDEEGGGSAVAAMGAVFKASTYVVDLVSSDADSTVGGELPVTPPCA